MIREFEVLNVKCGGCANTLKTSLEKTYSNVEVNLDVEPRIVKLEIEENQIEELKKELRSLGYPLATDELSPFQTVTTKATSYVSCAVGKMSK